MPVRLNTNENSYDVPAEVVGAVVDAVAEVAGSLNRYPDREFTALREDLAAYLGATTGVPVTPEQVWAGNGSNEVLLHLLQAFGGPGRTALGFTPAYSMHPIITRTAGTTWVDGLRGVPGGGAFDLDADGVAAQVAEHRPHLVFLCSPNNPTGTALGLDVVRAAYDAAPEAHRRGRRGLRRVRPPRHPERADPARGPDAARGDPHHEQGLRARRRPAGLPRRRPRSSSDALRLVRMPYHLSSPTQAVARAALAHAGALLATVEVIKGQRDRIVAELAALGLDPVPSDANFVLFGGLADERATWQALLEQGVLVRDVGIAHYLRVTAGTPAETDAFLDGHGPSRSHPPAGAVRMTEQVAVDETATRHRTASIRRSTSESSVELDLDLDGTGESDISTGVRFYDHMLASLAKHSLIDLRVKAVGDVDVDAHHTVEDVAIVLGDALREALGDKRGISRFGDATVPLDEALVQAVVDVAGRPYVVHEGEPEGQVYAVIGGTYTGSLTRHVLESFAYHAGIALHVRVLAGRDPHHLVEAQFKAVARALRAAVARDPRVVGHPEREGQPVEP